MADLTASQLAIAFTFARSESASVRLASGSVVEVAADVPRFDHDLDGRPRGLLITAGAMAGGEDQLALDPLILSADLVESDDLGARAATVFHEFRPLADSELSRSAFEAGITRRAYYTREAVRMVDALMMMQGHHLAIGVHAGFAQNRDGVARYRGKLWQLPTAITADDGALSGEADAPLITSGAELLG